MVLAGCASKVARWENAGTLVSVRPAEGTSRASGRLGTALGDAELGRTRVETTEGVYIVLDKIGSAQTGAPVKVGYSEEDSSDEPSYLSLGGRQYEIAR
ncbi:MAG: hypothetical protein AMJ65_08125 [Phycisphaerae bacterium SG8_4]|nr:MAG: hypothetical protein AMJ65_08125 [Phycisphaerae bacterium SG8_4]